MRRAEKRLTRAGGRRTAQLKIPNQRRCKLGCIAWDLAGFTIKIGVLGLLVVNESQIGNPLTKTGFVVRKILN